MIRSRYILLVIALLGCVPPAYGQPFFDLLNARKLMGPGSLGSSAADQNLQSEYDLLAVNVPVPLQKSPSRTLVLAPYADRWLVNATDSNLALRGYGIPVNLLWSLDSSRWELLASVIFRWNAFEATLRDPSQYGMAVMLGKRYSNNLRLRYGIYANREYFGWWVLPLLGVDWTWKNGTRVFGILPASLTWERHLSKHWYHGFTYRSATTSYRIPENRYLRINETQFGAFVDFYPLPFLAVNAEAGHSLFRNFRAGLVDTRGLEVPVRDTWYLRFGISIRKRLDR